MKIRPKKSVKETLPEEELPLLEADDLMDIFPEDNFEELERLYKDLCSSSKRENKREILHQIVGSEGQEPQLLMFQCSPPEEDDSPQPFVEGLT